MTPDLATAFARETVDAIRRALTPLSARIEKISEALSDVLGDFVDKRCLEEVTGKIAADVRKEIAAESVAIASEVVAIAARVAALESGLARATEAIAGLVETRDAAIDARLMAWEKQREETREPPPDVAAMVAEAVKAIPTVQGPPGESFRYRGVFDAGEAYAVGDWVTHEGTLWAALGPSKGLTPGDSAAVVAWRMAMKRPRDGVNGIGMNWRGPYGEGEIYRLNDVVKHAGRLFVCRRATSEPPPLPGGASATEWALMLEG